MRLRFGREQHVRAARAGGEVHDRVPGRQREEERRELEAEAPEPGPPAELPGNPLSTPQFSPLFFFLRARGDAFKGIMPSWLLNDFFSRQRW